MKLLVIGPGTSLVEFSGIDYEIYDPVESPKLLFRLFELGYDFVVSVGSAGDSPLFGYAPYYVWKESVHVRREGDQVLKHPFMVAWAPDHGESDDPDGKAFWRALLERASHGVV